MAGHSSHASHSNHSNHSNHSSHGNHTNTGTVHSNSGAVIDHSDRNTGVPINLTSPPPIIEVFKTSRSWTVPAGVTSARVLVVAGGGGGGSDMGGGGGGGGVIEDMAYALTPGANMSVTVGAGGAGDPGNKDNSHTDRYGSNGGNSIFGTLTAIGGGGGGGGDGSPEWDGRSGGCGGGASGYNGGGVGGAGTNGQGFAGGNSGGSHYSGGGGGAGAVGASGNNTPHGGIGKASDILGTNYYWGGGGGGSAYTGANSGDGGNGGGGGGAGKTSGAGGAGLNPGAPGDPSGAGQANDPGGPAGVNTGGGGGGGSHYNYSNKGGDGGSGIVVVSYQDPNAADWTDWEAPTVGTIIKSASSADTIQELREKIEFLQKEKGQTTHVVNDYIVPDNTAIDMTGAEDSDMAVEVEVVDVTYDVLQNALDSVHTDILGTDTGLVKKNPNDLITGTYIESLNTKINDIASADVSAQHASHSNSGVHTNHGNHSSHSNHSSTSDERLKKNIEELNGALDIIMKLKPVTYEWKDQSVDKDSYYGFIAQDIEKILPQWIPEIEGIKHIKPHNFEWESLIIKAIQEQQSILNSILEEK